MAEEKLALAAGDEGDNRPMALTGRNLNYLMGRKRVDATTLSKEIGLGIATVNAMRRGGPKSVPEVGTRLVFIVSMKRFSAF